MLRKTSPAPIAVLLHDGTKWHSASFCFERENCRCTDTRIVDGSDSKTLPEELLIWARENRCERVRVFLPTEVHELDPHLPADAEPVEVQTALAFELAPGLKLAPSKLRVAAVRSNTYRMGGDPDQLLAAAFDIRITERYESTCRTAGLRFDGVGSLEMATLARHARDASEKGLLLIRDSSIFAAAPARNGDAFFVRNIPFGPPQEKDFADAWSDRLAQRLQCFHKMPILIVTSCDTPVTLAPLVTKTLGCEVTETIPLDELAPMILRHAAWANVGVIDSGCASIAKPKPKQNWKRMAAITASMLVLFAITACIVVEIILRQSEPELKKIAEKIQNTERFESTLRQEIQTERSFSRLLDELPRVEAILLAILDELPEAIGRYSRIVRFREEDGRFIIEGETHNPADLTALRRTLDHAVEPLGWRVEEGGIVGGHESGLWLFTHHITRGGR